MIRFIEPCFSRLSLRLILLVNDTSWQFNNGSLFNELLLIRKKNRERLLDTLIRGRNRDYIFAKATFFFYNQSQTHPHFSRLQSILCYRASVQRGTKLDVQIRTALPFESFRLCRTSFGIKSLKHQHSHL